MDVSCPGRPSCPSMECQPPDRLNARRMQPAVPSPALWASVDRPHVQPYAGKETWASEAVETVGIALIRRQQMPCLSGLKEGEVILDGRADGARHRAKDRKK